MKPGDKLPLDLESNLTQQIIDKFYDLNQLLLDLKDLTSRAQMQAVGFENHYHFGMVAEMVKQLLFVQKYYDVYLNEIEEIDI